ncbi:MAG: RluA family pseudouridine synthase [Oscillospiraceae bacterium]|nr:RluA family pseudouridine synthase [Oscillospiraceae bacterium]
MILNGTVPDEYGGRELKTFLRHELRLSASLIRRLKTVQGISVNGSPVYTSYKLQAGEIVTVDISAAEPPCDVVPQSGHIEILYENSGLIAVNKPCGLIVHPSHSKYTGTLANFVAGYLQDTCGIGVCHAVNRLDRDTSGAVLFAKNSHFKTLASKALSAPDAVKEYLALVYGHFDQCSGTIDLPIRRAEAHKLLRIPAEDGQPAVTRYEVVLSGLYEGEPVSLLRLRLETGRTHQIRVHCLAVGHPLLGDIMYYTEASRAFSERIGISAQALHAHRLDFTDPVTGRHISLAAPQRRSAVCKIIDGLGKKC